MGYVFALIALVLVFLALHFFTELSLKQKSIFSLIFATLVVLAIFYNAYNDKQQERLLEIATRFNQSLDIECDGVVVNSHNFTLSIGTYTFIGKKDSNFNGMMISATKCKY